MTWGQLVGIGGGYWWFVFLVVFVVFEGFKKLIHISPYMLYIFGIRVTGELFDDGLESVGWNSVSFFVGFEWL